MPKRNNTEYDIVKALEAIEDELIASMINNLDRHRAAETKEGFMWSQWQVEQLAALEKYKRHNSKKYGTVFKKIDSMIDALISEQRSAGNEHQEIAILNAIKNGFKAHKVNENLIGEFFQVNDRKMDALIEATKNDLKKAEYAMLRMANDKYRKVIFNAQAYAASGTTYEKAVDMATRDYLSAGINCVEYKNGARHTVSDYADMCIRTANKRAYLTGEGEMRMSWGVHTVIMNKRTSPCPKCLPFVGKVLIDDVWSDGTASDGNYQLMSSAMAAGLYHPRCKDSHTTYFEGISAPPDCTWNRKELSDIEQEAKNEARQEYAERQHKRCSRLAKYSLDEDNKRIYKHRAEQWKSKKEALENDGESSTIKLQINLFDKDDELYLDAISIEPEDGFEDVCLHGSPTSVQKKIDGKITNMNASEFALYLKENTNYRGNDIRLASCSTGKGDNSFAQQLSKELGNVVKAPTMDVYYAPDEGVLFVGSPHENIGKWRTFKNGVEVI